MVKLILVKHAPPEVIPGVPSSRWVLSEDGRARRLFAGQRPHPVASATTSGLAPGVPVMPIGRLPEQNAL